MEAINTLQNESASYFWNMVLPVNRRVALYLYTYYISFSPWLRFTGRSRYNLTIFEIAYMHHQFRGNCHKIWYRRWSYTFTKPSDHVQQS